MARNLYPFILLATLLAGCFDSGSSTPAPQPQPEPETETLTGVVAVGAPVTDAIVTARCGSDQDSATTGGGGGYTLVLPDGATPCLMRAAGGTPDVTLYSFAPGPGNTNITPLTTMAAARGVMMATGATSLDDFFEQDEIDLSELAAAVGDELEGLLAALEAAGYEFPEGFDPLSDEFEAQFGDPYDDLLEELAEALVATGQSLDDFIAAWLGGAAIPPAVVEDDDDDDDGDIENPTGPDLIGAFAGTYEIGLLYEGLHARGTVTISADNSVDFDSDRSYSAADADGAAVYDRLGCCNRVDVDYANGDRLRLYRAESGDLRDIYLDTEDGIVAVTFLDALPEATADGTTLDGNGIIGTVDGVPYRQEAQEGIPRFLMGSFGTFTLNGVGVEPVWTISRVPAEVGVHHCTPLINGTGIEFLGNPRSEAGGSTGKVGRCTITVTRIVLNQFDNATAAEGKFSVELLLRGGPDERSGDDHTIVTDGYFRYDP